MDRREAIEKVAWLLGGTVIGSSMFLEYACNPAAEKEEAIAAAEFFTRQQVQMLNEMGETILPATSSPGAKEAKVGEFMEVMVRDCYTPREQSIFREGLERMDEGCKKDYGKTFMECDASQRTAFFNKMDQTQKAYMKAKSKEQPPHYFLMLKQLTLLGFFTSEAGATKALRYIAIPGKYDGNLPYKKGDKAWAT